MTTQPEVTEDTYRRYGDGEIRQRLSALLAWADGALDGDGDRQYIAEHMTNTIDALLVGDELPERPF